MRAIWTLCLRNLRNFMRNRIRLLITFLTPFAFIYVLSSLFQNQLQENSVNHVIAGVTIATVFQTSLNIAATTIEDISSGYMKEILVSPINRFQVAFGQLLAGALIATMQGFIIFVIGMFTGLGFEKPHTIVLVFLSMFLVGMVYSALGLWVATIVRDAQTYQIVGQAVVLPLVFLSGAYVPVSLFPTFLEYLSYANPMTYTTMFFRAIVLENNGTDAEMVKNGLALNINGFIFRPWMSGLAVFGCGLVFLAMATVTFQRADFTHKRKRSRKTERVE